MRPPKWDQIRTFFSRAAPPADPLADAELLARFVRARDEAAFETFLWRHGSMVLAVCRRIVGDEQLAEDAFQATFLILARKAASLRKSASVAAWLHRVARRVATRAAKRRAVRVGREKELSHEPVSGEREPDADLREILDREIDRLPDRYRLPVILCYVQGNSTADAARQLGVPKGTVLSRLATARARLAERLTRRGALVAAGMLVSSGGAATAINRSLIETTFRAAVVFVDGAAAAVPGPSVLANEVLRMSVLKQTVGLLLAVTLTTGVGTSVAVVASQKPNTIEGVVAQAKAVEPPLQPATERRGDPEKPSAEQRAKQIESIRKMEAMTLNQIELLSDLRKKRGQTNADVVGVGALRDSLLLIDRAIITAEDEAAQATDKAKGKLAEENMGRLLRRRSELVIRIFRAQEEEEINRLHDDELRVYRELRQQLLLQRLLLRFEAEGVYLRSPIVGQFGDDRSEKLVRGLEELKAEIQRLKASRNESRSETSTPRPD